MKKLLPSLLFLSCAFTLTASVHTIQVSDFAFTPSNVNAFCGDSIVWVRVSGTHTTTSNSVPSCATQWNAPMTAAVDSFVYIVQCSGLYLYECTMHPVMTGMINVACATVTETPDRPVVNFYPNPFTSRLTILPGNNDKVELTDVLGKVRATEHIVPGTKVMSMDLAVPAGIYLLRFYSAGILQETRKLVCNR